MISRMFRLVASASLVACLLSACSGSGAGQAEPSSHFTLDFWAVPAGDAGEREALTARHVLENGSEVGLTLDPGKLHVYVVYQDAEGALEVLHSGEDTKGGAVALLPPGAALDDQAGHERFCVLASVERLHDLELAIEEFRSDPTGAREKLLAEVSALRDRHESQESEPPRPVTIGGQVRGESPNAPVPTAREYPVAGVRCHTITLEHR